MTRSTSHSRPSPLVGIGLMPLVSLCGFALGGFGCSDSDHANADSGPRNPIDTAAAPLQPAAGLGMDRPDPCRGVALPPDQHYVTPGLCASAVAFDVAGLRQISFASNGDLLGVKTNGDVVRFRDLDADGMFSGSTELSKIGNTGGNGNNAHLDESGGFLYAGSPDGVVRWPYTADTQVLGTPEPVVINQPSTGSHPYHTVHVYGGWLYVHSGSAQNVAAPATPEYDMNRSVLERFDLSAYDAAAPFDWANGEVVASGLRNMVGYTQRANGDLFGVVNGIDDLEYAGQDVHFDNPGEVLIQIQAGSSYGYPFCFTVQDIPSSQPGTQLASATKGFTNPHDDAWCQQNSEPPLSFLQAHSAPLDITFYETARQRRPPGLCPPSG